MIDSLRQFVFQEDGTTAVEYAVLLAMILLAAIGSISTFGGGMGSKWTHISTEITSAMP